MFYTNTTSPNLYTVTDTYHDIAIRLAGWITGAASSPWAEVTGAGPTPTWLQPYASTAVAGHASATYNGAAWHTTLYLTTDPGLAAGDPYCVMIRFTVCYHGLALQIIDTATGDPAVDEDWTFQYATDQPDQNTSTAYGDDEVGAKLMAIGGLSSELAVVTAANVECHLWIWDEVLVIMHKDVTNTSYQEQGGGAFIWTRAVNGMEGADRTDMPHIWSVSGGWASATDTRFVDGHIVPYYPAWKNSAFGFRPTSIIGQVAITGYEFGFCGAELGLHIETEATDINGDNVIQRLMWITDTEYSRRTGFGSSVVLPLVEGPRAIRVGLLGANTMWDTMTIDSVDYTIIKNASPGTYDVSWDCIWLLPHSDLT